MAGTTTAQKSALNFIRYSACWGTFYFDFDTGTASNGTLHIDRRTVDSLLRRGLIKMAPRNNALLVTPEGVANMNRWR